MAFIELTIDARRKLLNLDKVVTIEGGMGNPDIAVVVLGGGKHLIAQHSLAEMRMKIAGAQGE